MVRQGDTTFQGQASILPIIKVGFISRDTSLAASTVAYTGIGFKPGFLRVYYCQEDSHPAGRAGIGWHLNWSISDYEAVIAGSYEITQANMIQSYQSSGVVGYGHIDSLDSDGFTISWGKTGAASGNLNVLYEAYK